MKTPTEEIQYLGQMLACTQECDTTRINAIISRLKQITTTAEDLRDPRDWTPEVPKYDGDYYYTGPTPEGKEVVAIVGIVTLEGERQAYVFLPPRPEWKGAEVGSGTLHFGRVAEWKGKWAGPDHGLCCCCTGENSPPLPQ